MATKTKKFMGHELTERKPGEYALPKKGLHAIMDDNGVTKEVRDTVAACDETIAEEAIKFLGKEVVAKKKDQRLVLGTGHGKTTFTMKGKTEHKNIHDGSKIVRYGQVSVSKKQQVPSALKKGTLADLQSQVEKAFS